MVQEVPVSAEEFDTIKACGSSPFAPQSIPLDSLPYFILLKFPRYEIGFSRHRHSGGGHWLLPAFKVRFRPCMVKLNDNLCPVGMRCVGQSA